MSETAAARPLYEMGNEYQAIVDELWENGGELTPELARAMDAVEQEITEKVERIALYVKNLTAEAAKHKAEEQRQADWRKRNEQTVARLKEYIKTTMEQTGIDRVETTRAKVRIVGTGGQAPITCTLKPEQIPEAFRRVTIDLDREKVREAAADGLELPEGIEIQERGKHLRVQ